MKPKSKLRFFLRAVLTGISITYVASTAQAQTWANSNITATPTPILDWFSGGPNSQGLWTGGDPVSGSGTAVTFFADTTTALGNSVAVASIQTSNLNNGASAFQLGVLTLNGRGSGTTGAFLLESITGSAFNFSGATGTINLNSVNNTANLGFQIGSNVQLGSASSASAFTLTGNGSGAFSISGNIRELQTGGGSLTKSGSSVVTLSGNNTYTGATSVTGGTLRLGSTNALSGGIGATGGSTALTLNGGVLDLAADHFLRNLGTGASQFRIAGGTSGFSTRGGVRDVIVNDTAAQEIQWGSVDFNPTTLVLNAATADSQLTLQNRIDLNGATRTISSDAGANLVDRGAAAISGIIRTSSGTAGLTKTGGGILRLQGLNTFNDAVTVSAGTLSINTIANGGSGNSSSLGESSSAAASLLLANGATLRYTGAAASSDRSFTSNGASATIDASGSGALNLTATATPAYGTAGQARTLTLSGTNPGTNTLAALIADNGSGVVSLTKSGRGTWLLTNPNNSFTGAVTVTGNTTLNFPIADTLVISSIANGGSASALGQSSSAAASLRLGNGAVLRYTGAAASSDRSFTINGTAAGHGATLDASGAGTLNLTSNSTPAYGTTNQTRTLTLSGNNTGNNTLSALLTNNGASTNAVTLAKAGQGTWVLNGSGVNTYTGGTNVNTGTLALDFANLATPTDLINSATPITFGGGTLSSRAKNNQNSAQTFPNPAFSSQAGSGIAVSGTGTGTMVLTLGNTWTRNLGSTANVALGAGGTLSSAPATVNTLVVGSGNIAFATVGGSDWAKVDSGNVVAFAGSDYDTAFPASSATATTNYSLIGNGSVTASQTANTLKITTTTTGQALAMTSGQILTLNAGGLLFTGGNDYNITGGTLRGSGGTQKELAVHQFGGGNLTIDSIIANNGAATVLTKSGIGTLTLGAANTHNGATYAGGGGSLVLKNQNALQSSPLFVNNSGIVFDSSVSGNAFTVGGLNSPYAGPGYDIVLQNNGGAPIALTVNGSGTYNGNLSGSGSLIKSGSGNLVLQGANTFTGGITINTGGGVTMGGANDWALGAGGTFGNVQVTVNSGGTLNMQAATITGTLTMNGGTLDSANNFGIHLVMGSIILQSTSTFVNNPNAGTIFIPAVISGPGGFTKGSAVDVALQAANTFTGDTRINNGGTLSLMHPLALRNSTLDTLNSTVGGLRAFVDTLTLGGLSGNKNLSLVFTTAAVGSFYTNTFNRAGGVIPLGGYAGITELTLNPGTGKTPSYSGVIADGAPGMSVIKTGPGTQTLSGPNTYTGATIISAGTLALANDDVLPDISNVIIGGGILNMDIFFETVGTLDVVGAATINLGSGAALAFANSSAVDWTGGTLNVTGTLGATSLRFGTTSGSLTPAQLALISVNGSGAGTYTLDASGFLVAGAGSAYDTWKAANAPGSNPNDDTDGDGVSNAVEFVLGGLASTKDLGKLPVIATSGANMTFTFARAVSSIDPKTALFIQTSNDLATWNTAPSSYTVPDGAITNNPGVTVVKNTSVGFDTVTLTVPRAPETKRFARLRVVITP